MINPNFATLTLPLIPLIGWGLMGILITKISRLVGEFVSSFLILLFSLIFVLGGWPLFAQPPFNINVFIYVILGFFGAVIYLLLNKAYKTGNASVVAPIAGTWGVFSAILGILIYKESLTIYKFISIIAVSIGIFLISTKGKFRLNFKKSHIVAGALIALLTAIGYGALFFYLATVSRNNGWYITTVYMQIFNVLFLLVFLLPKLKIIKTKLNKVPWKYIVLAGLVDATAFTTYNLAVTKLDVSYTAVIASASPLITVIAARILFNEITTKIQRIGIILSISGVILLQLLG